MKNAVIMLLNNLQSKDGEFSFAELLKLNDLTISQCNYALVNARKNISPALAGIK